VLSWDWVNLGKAFSESFKAHTVLTLRIVDGPDRGRVFKELSTPVSIGREEGNVIQLNDDRVSRFHLKIQEDRGRLVLTDLDSTNGTRVNGEHVQLWNLQYGDVIGLGRSIILLGSRQQVAQRLAKLRGVEVPSDLNIDPEALLEGGEDESFPLERELFGEDGEELMHQLLGFIPPNLPEGLTPGQAAQLSEMMQFVHVRIRRLVDSVERIEKSRSVTLSHREWQGLVDLYDRLAQYIHKIENPHGSL